MMKKILAKAAQLLYFTAGFLFFLSRPAKAYIDPSTTTFIIQAVSGAAIAVGAFGVILWRKANKKVSDKLNIEQNKNREVEADVEGDEE